MSWRNARGRASALLLVALSLTLHGCGFQPLYADRSATNTGAAGLGDVTVAVIPDRIGQILRLELEDRFRRSPASHEASYVLEVSLQESSIGTAVDIDESATRANQMITARYTLRNGDEAVYSGAVSATSSYNILRADYATIVAERDARQRNVMQIADLMQRDLAILFLRAERDPDLLSPKRPDDRPPTQ